MAITRRLEGWWWNLRAPLLVLAIFAACKAPAERPAAVSDGEWRTFEGTWTAGGDRRAMETALDRTAAVVDLSGSILLTGERGLGVGFQARLLAYTDGAATTVGRAVWTDDQGDRIFSEVRGESIGTGRRVTGTFTGGTGRWTGIAGDYVVDWKYVIATDGRISGRSEDLHGRARIVARGGAR